MRRALLAGQLLALGAGAHAADFGRLFSSATERAAIDAAREARRAPPDALVTVTPRDAEASTPSDTPPPPPAPVTVNGYVARSAGAPTVWVNGSDAASGRLTPPRDDGRRVQVPLGAGAGQVSLKPGQSFDPDTRRVSDAYEQRPRASE